MLLEPVKKSLAVSILTGFGDALLTKMTFMKFDHLILCAFVSLLCTTAFFGMGCGGGSDGDGDSAASDTNTVAMATNDMSTVDMMSDSDLLPFEQEAQDAARTDDDSASDEADSRDDDSSGDDATQSADTTSGSQDDGVSSPFSADPENLPAPTVSSTGGRCNLSGNWSGVYYNTELGFREGISASVTTSGSSIVIRTTKSSPPGQFLTGEINGSCGITLLDASDGSDWTTKFGAADANQLRIADFLVELRDPLTGVDPLDTIELYR